MPINYRELTQEQYNALTGDLVKLTESLHALPGCRRWSGHDWLWLHIQSFKQCCDLG